MFKASAGKTLPTSIIGSLPRPSWYTAVLGAKTFLEAMVNARYICARKRPRASISVPTATGWPQVLLDISQECWPIHAGHPTVVMDNCRVHKVAGVEEAIKAHGARVEYLPKYSPDLNPIELSFSSFKAYLRKFAEQTIPALCKRVGAFVRRVSSTECRNYFRHAGYVSFDRNPL